jgi:hypothetical protein
VKRVDKVWIVTGSCGSYSNFMEWNVRAFTDPLVAEQFRAACAKEMDRVREDAAKVPEPEDPVYTGSWFDFAQTPEGKKHLAASNLSRKARQSIVSKYDPHVEGSSHDSPDYGIAEVEVGWPDDDGTKSKPRARGKKGGGSK